MSTPSPNGHTPLLSLRVAQLQDFVAQQDGHTPLLLDVREPWEVAMAPLSLPGARTVAIPMAELPQRLAELPTAQPILALCHHGVRSLQCVAFLVQQGYTQVYNISGGIDAWSTQVDPSVPRY